MSLQKASVGDIVLSKIDLKNGAVGVLEPEIGDAAVTTHFAVYRADESKLVPLYFRYLIQTRPFKDWLWSARSGADGRTEVKLNVFEELAIPLPTPTEQQALVVNYTKALADAAAMEVQAQEQEAQGLADFEAALGLAPPPPLPDRPVFVARFGALDRWGHDAVLAVTAGIAAQTPHFPVVKLGSVITDVRVGSSPKCKAEPRIGNEWGVLKISAVTSGTFKPDENKAVKSASDVSPLLEVKQGDILIARGSGAAKFVGAVCLVGSQTKGLLLCDLIFRVVGLNTELIDPRFLVEVLRTPALRRQIEESRTGRAPGIQKTTKKALLALTFPLPTKVDEQKKLITTLGAARKSAADLRAKATETRRAGWEAFEAAIFG